MKRKLLLSAVFSMLVSMVGFAQSPDKNSMGFFTIPGYPYCYMDNNSQTYCIVTDDIVPIESGSPNMFIRRSLFLVGRGLTEVLSPDGADIVISIDNRVEKTTEVNVFDASKPRPKPKRECRHSTVLKIGNFSVFTDAPSSSEKSAPAPQGHLYVARASREVGFSVKVTVKNEVVFTDTIYSMQEFESEQCPDRVMAKNQVIEKLKGYTLATSLTGYSPFLSKVIGTTGLTTMNFKIYSVKMRRKCQYDYTDINEAQKSFETAYDFLKKRPLQVEEFKTMAAPVVKVWESTIAQANLTDENARVNKSIAAAMYYNMAVYSAMIGDYKACVDYFNKSDKTDLDFADAVRMVPLAQTWVKAQEAYEAMMATKK